MTKVVVGGIIVMLLLVVGLTSSFFTPLATGVNNNLGGSPKLPFNNPIPLTIRQQIHSFIAHITPQQWTIGIAVLLSLLFLSGVLAIIGSMHHRHRVRRDEKREKRMQARISDAMRTEKEETPTSTTQPTLIREIDRLWK